jgi:hypothetical protein
LKKEGTFIRLMRDTDNRGLPSSFIHVAIAAGKTPADGDPLDIFFIADFLEDRGLLNNISQL